MVACAIAPGRFCTKALSLFCKRTPFLLSGKGPISPSMRLISSGLFCRRALRARSVVFQCAAVCCSVLQCLAVCCRVLQCVAVCYSVLPKQGYCDEYAVRCSPISLAWLWICIVCVCVCACVRVCVCVCLCCSPMLLAWLWICMLCVRERESVCVREREKERECVCVFVLLTNVACMPLACEYVF